MNQYHSDFTRWIWVSAAARLTWEPRIQDVVRVWGGVEMLAVAAGVRDAALLFPMVEELPAWTRRAAASGLLLLPLNVEGASSGLYSSTSATYVPGQPGKYRAVLVRPERAGAALDAWGRNDEAAIGQLLGYPPCCTRFFERVWVREQRVDTTLAMAEAANGDTSGPPESNILLRWLGVRLVPHLPCSFACEATIAFARRLGPVWAQMDGGQVAVEWACEMLSWPMEWTALHGIAEIRTPILTICSRTDWTPSKAVVAKQGTSYPDEGAVGLRFPYRVVKDKVTKAPAFQRSVTPAWELNGFSSQAAMDAAHDVLISALPSRPEGKLLDLGCGNGRLLERAKALGWVVEGVEADPVRAGAAQIPVRRGDMFDTTLWDSDYGVVLIMPGRLIEAEQNSATRLCAALRQRARHVVLYAYGDWLERYGGLGPLAAQAGLGDGDVVSLRNAPGVEAALVTLRKVA